MKAAVRLLGLAVLLAACAAPGAAPGVPVSTAAIDEAPGAPAPTQVADDVKPAATAPTATPESFQTPFPDTPTSDTFDTCTPSVRVLDGHFLLGRPISSEYTQIVERTYRYGHTLAGTRDPHTGVEFINRPGTPVLAAADGVVVFAAPDDDAQLAPWPFYYGNAVVVEHTLPGIDEPVYTLYAHLLSIDVAAGQRVSRGELVGSVGATGVAIGNHLHFEVRVGANEFTATQNPELWLEPLRRDGVPNGALAGYVVNASGERLRIENLVVTRLANGARIYFEGYHGEIEGDHLWQERFAIGGLAPGSYELAFTADRLYRQVVEVEAGRLTLVAFCSGD